MLCKNCGNEMNNGATFCNRCGVNHGNTQTGNNRHGNSTAINVASSACLKKNTRTELMPIIIIVAIIVGSFVFGGLKVIFSLLVDDDFGSPFGETQTVKSIAVATVREQISVKRDQEVYDVEILDEDGYGNYIVAATTEDHLGFETWWFLLIKIDRKTDKYIAYTHYHGQDDWDNEISGGRFTRDNLPDYYRNNDKFGWGEENHIE